MHGQAMAVLPRRSDTAYSRGFHYATTSGYRPPSSQGSSGYVHAELLPWPVNEVAKHVLKGRASHRIPADFEFRYVLHEYYQSTLVDSRPGQQQLIMHAATTSGLVLKRQSLNVFIDEDFQEETLTDLVYPQILSFFARVLTPPKPFPS